MNNVDEYKNWYKQNYGKMPSEKLVKSFCLSNGIKWPPVKDVEIEVNVPVKVNMLFGKECETKYEINN